MPTFGQVTIPEPANVSAAPPFKSMAEIDLWVEETAAGIKRTTGTSASLEEIVSILKQQLTVGDVMGLRGQLRRVM